MDEDDSKARSWVTINTFYHETQQEVLDLKKQIRSKDGIIADLKAKLSRYERTCFTKGEEPCLVGPSKSLVESLCRANCRLNQQLKNTEMDISQKLESSKREIQTLKQKLREREHEMDLPEHEKDREIQHLRVSLKARDRAHATQDVLCNSLTEDSKHLKGQLCATVRVCEELLGRLEKHKNRTSNTEQSQNSETSDTSEVTHLNAIVSKLQEQNQQLQKRVAYVESLNSKWQKYNLSREEYVRGLCQDLKETSGLPYQQEIGRLNGLLEEKMLECERLSRGRDECLQREREKIQMLEQQVLTNVEDFRSERSDRERAQSKISDLQEIIKRLQLQIREQNPQEAPARRFLHNLKKPSRKQVESAVSCLRNSPPDTSAKRPGGQLPSPGSSELQCPLCLTMYDDKQTDEFMKHCDECANL